MADGRLVDVRRLVAAVSAGWVQSVAFLAPRCRRAVAAVRSGWVQSVAFLAPRCRRAVAAVRSGWVQSVAYLVSGYRRAVGLVREVARTTGDRARSVGHELGDWFGGLRRRSKDADLRGRMSQLVKQRSEIDRAEYVALNDLLEKDERERQYQ